MTYRGMIVLTVAALVPSLSHASVLWRGDFETGDISQWTRAQSVSPDRLQIIEAPVREGRYAMKATVVAGDNPIGASGNRNELVYLSYEPKGTERWYRWSTQFALDYPSANNWQLWTQWHHSGDSGSPPVEFTARGDNIQLGVQGEKMWEAPMNRGQWHDMVFHVKWSDDPSEGFVELWHNGELAIPKTFVATQFSGQSQYLKQGCYTDAAIQATRTVYHDGFVAGETREDVWPADDGQSEPIAGNDPAQEGGDLAVDGSGAEVTPANLSGIGEPAAGCSVAGGPAALPLTALFGLAGFLWRRRARR